MNASLRALLSGIIDYAGLFPPARLPLDAAIRCFVLDRAGPDAWMLSRFVLPAARLAELSPYRDELLTPGAAFPLVILGRGGADADAFLSGLDRDLADIELFLERHPGGSAIDVFEVKLPQAILEPPNPSVLADLLDRAAAMIEERARVPLQLFYEGTYGPDWHRLVTLIVDAIAERRGRSDGAKALAPGFKLRCGGTESVAFPSVEQVAAVIARCRDAKVPFKATAGLHHPVRHLDRELIAKVHGFLNVFGAAVLAHARGLDEATIAEVVADEDPSAFVFEGEQFRWREHGVTTAEIVTARRVAAVAFGSCSFDEPREDLQRIGLWDGR